MIIIAEHLKQRRVLILLTFDREQFNFVHRNGMCNPKNKIKSRLDMLLLFSRANKFEH